jgi:hypothetical protein
MTAWDGDAAGEEGEVVTISLIRFDDFIFTTDG